MVDDIEIRCNGVSQDSKLISFRITEKLNQVPCFDAKLVDVATSDANVKYGNWFSGYYDSAYVFPKFHIDTVDRETDLYVNISGIGWVERKLDGFKADLAGTYVAGSSALRPEYSLKTPDEIVGWQLGLTTTGVSKGTCLSASTDAINIRSENDSMISFFYGIGSVAGTDSFGSYSSDLATSSINITTKGTDKSATVIFNISGSSQNIDDSSRKIAYEELANVVICLGYGDGINQLQSRVSHATSSRTRLSAAIDEDDTTCTVADGSVLPASGSVWIGCEKCNFTRSTNTLTLTRGVAFQGNVSKAYAHAVNSPVCDAQYTEAAPQSIGTGSSINSNQVKQMSFDMKEIIDQSTLDIVAEKILSERKGIGSSYTPPEIVTINPSDYLYAVKNVFTGDTVAITDADAGLTGSYRVVEKITVYGEDGVPYVKLVCSNSVLNLLEDIFDDADKAITLSKYMQGATNIFSVNETDNVEAGDTDYQGLTLFFNIPEDAVAINSVKLSYRNEAPKTWSSVTAGESSHTHTIPSLTVNATTTSSTTSDSTDFTQSEGNDSLSLTTYSPSTQYGIMDEAYTGTFNLIHACVYINFVPLSGSPTFPSAGEVAIMVYIGSDVSDPRKSIRRNYYVPANYTGLIVKDTFTFFNDGADPDSKVYVKFSHNFSDDIRASGTLYIYGEDVTHTHPIAGTSVNGTTTVSSASSAGSSHSHSVAYDLAQQSYSTTDVKVWTSNDTSGSPTWTERTAAIETALGRALNAGNNQSEVDLPLTSFFSSPGWKGIRLTTNGNSRIKAQVTTKCYINSRVD